MEGLKRLKRVKTIIDVVSIDLFDWAYRNWVKLTLVLALASWLVVVSWPRLTWLSPRLAGWSDIKIVFCSAGQGDETLIQTGFTQILIDGSQPGRALDCLRKHVPFFDRQIEMVVVSHPQVDHFGGLTDVVKRYKVISFVYNGLRGNSHEWEELSKAVVAEGAKIEVVAAGDEVRVGEMKLKVLWPEKSVVSSQLSVVGSQSISYQSIGQQPTNRKPADQNLTTENRKPMTDSVLGAATSGELNSGTVMMELNYGDFEALFTGDIGEEEEMALVTKGPTFFKKGWTLGSVDVLKVAHHGSKYSSSLDFLKVVRPALAVIEVGKNSYGHPTAEVLERLRQVGAEVLRTDQDGDVVVETDGKKWEVKTKR